jgi:hypothetical protein
MITRNDKSIYIHFSAQQVRKLEVMRESIEEPVSRQDIIDGLIEGGYVLALKTLYDAGQISKEDYESCLKQVPDYFLMEL